MKSPFANLPAPPHRKYVPNFVDGAQWEQVELLFQELLERKLNDVEELECWLEDQFELKSVLKQAAAMAYISMTCDTNDPGAEASFLQITQKLEPASKPYWNQLDIKLLGHPLATQLPPHYEMMLKNRRNAAELFREENVLLEAEEARLAQNHEKIKGAQTAVFEGKQQTLIQLTAYLERPDRTLRQQAFEAISARRLLDKAALNGLFDRMLELRHQQAQQAGKANFRDYQHQRLARFDYTPDDCTEFHAAVEKTVMPVIEKLATQRAQQMQLERLRPWDLDVDPLALPPLSPFQRGEDLAAGCAKIFQRLNPELGQQFQKLRDWGLLDLENRPGKAPGGYQEVLSEYRVPFIFMNAVGLDLDVRILLHEAGHAFHAFAVKNETVVDYRDPPIEFCEVASMSMELLGDDYLDEFYTAEESHRSRQVQLDHIVWRLAWIATIDAFQHWLYTHPGHTHAERTQAWRGVRARFRGPVDWTGYEEAEDMLWQKQGHLFSVPFYYIEYGIAQLGALGIWLNARRNPTQALNDYLFALSLGGSRGVRRLFEAADLKFEMNEQAMKPLMDEVANSLNI